MEQQELQIVSRDDAQAAPTEKLAIDERPGGGAKKDDVVDADFEEVKEG